ncbi:hypothetical protein Thal_1588 [Thermocrinis albus DSM 14484]|uniref:Uncharacterized protein n=1 Tax=Thermocrinis albus (strain DSM 14484 / JCM 11386 / HI 11/12) TaxID=638303 RepID=D3SN86_THEAH|nr:hypothetical protein [Thermocrinis albus]ADC90216.1 hypothetical protein Thal_1588 [Thermocrinis albus DSM 14484]
MARVGNLACVRLLVEHEIGELNRIRWALGIRERTPLVESFSLVLAKLPYMKEEYAHVVASTMRSSDVIFVEGDIMLAFLPGTDKGGAQQLMEGVRSFMGEEGRYVVVSYPDDGGTYEELISSLRDRAKENGIPCSFLS